MLETIYYWVASIIVIWIASIYIREFLYKYWPWYRKACHVIKIMRERKARTGLYYIPDPAPQLKPIVNDGDEPGYRPLTDQEVLDQKTREYMKTDHW
jgi:hypothetical protein